MVEGARLEIVWAFTRLEGSNPFISATVVDFFVGLWYNFGIVFSTLKRS